ncbi:MAG TPA: dihydrolipoyl dehydrogenase [Planctomycetota bacterium]|nr:dihydrolipoyl dehydrogenase [Planctomycetota bacterium]
MPDFDVIILGAGPGGYVAAIRAAQLGLKTAVVEKGPKPEWGGTCLHWGCIPTKVLLHDAYLYERVKDAARNGIEVQGVRLNLEGVMKHKEEVVRRNYMGVEALLKKNKVTMLVGFGKVVRPGVVDVAGKSWTARAIVLATGSAPKAFPGMEPDGKGILTSNEALSLKQVPKSLVVIGAGAVGMEFASVYHRFGAQVAVVELMPQILPVEDEEVAAELRKILAKRGMKFFTGAKVEAIKPGYEVHVSSGGKTEKIACDTVLVAVGRKPCTEGIGLENTKVRVEKGYVQVDSFMRTAEPGIYAIGDIVALPGRPHPQLAHVASAEGILAVEHLAGKAVRPIDYDRIPGVTYCDPQVASVGLTEKRARELGHKVKVGKFPFMGIGRAAIEGEREGFVKIVGDARYDEILGVHILHAHAGELVSEGVAVLNGEMTVEDLAHSVHPHPTLSEGLLEAAHAYLGHAIHI